MKGSLIKTVLVLAAATANSAAAQHFVNLNSDNQVLYTGRENIIEIPFFEEPITVRSRHGLVKQMDARHYFIYEPYRNTPATDTVVITNKSGLALKRRGFRVIYEPTAYFRLGTLEGDTVLSSDINKPGGPFGGDSAMVVGASHPVRVLGFQMSYKGQGKDYQGPFALNGNKVPAGPALRPGNTIYIDRVILKCEGCIQFVHPMSLNRKIYVK